MKYKNGAQFKGTFKNNIIEGEGVYEDEVGNVYEGQFAGGIFCGTGVMNYSNGDKYDGEWQHGKQHGQGNYTWANEDYYEGEWVQGSADGEGTKMVEGVFYSGAFHKGVKQGLGEETNLDCDTTKGIWANN